MWESHISATAGDGTGSNTSSPDTLPRRIPAASLCICTSRVLYALPVTTGVQLKIEIIRLRKEGEYFDVQVAIDGVLSPSMEIHASAREQYREEADFISYLTRSAQTV